MSIMTNPQLEPDIPRARSRLQIAIILVAALSVLALFLMPTPAGLTREAKGALAVFVLCLLLWVTNAIPLAATSLLALVLLPLVGAMKTDDVFALFGNKAVFFILGVLILSSGMMSSGLSARLALFSMRNFGRSPRILLAGVMLSGAFLSCWMPEHAVAAIMLPIALEIAVALKLIPGHHSYGKALFIALAWGANIGGVCTLLGGARNPLAIGMLHDYNGQSISFFQWMLAVVPITVVLLAVAFVVINVFFRIDIHEVAAARRALDEKIASMGRMSTREKRIGLQMLITILTWVFVGEKIGLANIAMLSAVLLFVFNLVDWPEVERNVNWGVIMMYGGAIALGSAMQKTGAATWLVSMALSSFKLTPFLLVSVIAFLSLLFTIGISNAAVVALLLPVSFTLSATYGVDPRVMVFTVAVPAGLDFCLPIGTPSNAIAYSAGYYRVSDSVRSGLVLDVLSWALFVLLAFYYWPLLGIRL
jgi:sodium-dependent dicarboxylate transporter 2/3/5